MDDRLARAQARPSGSSGRSGLTAPGVTAWAGRWEKQKTIRCKGMGKLQGGVWNEAGFMDVVMAEPTTAVFGREWQASKTSQAHPTSVADIADLLE